MRQLLSVLLILLTITLSSADYSLNNFEEDFLQRSSGVAAASLDSSATTIIFTDSSNCSCGVGQFTFQCSPDGHPQFDPTIPINLTVEVQQKLALRDVYIWIGRQGTEPTTDYTNWGTSIPSGGVSFSFFNLHGFKFGTSITLGDILSVITNPDGTFNSCFRIEVVLIVQRYCGFENKIRHIGRSPQGCDFDYQAIYPAADSYFHVALNNDGSLNVNNDTLFFKGYCLDPTRSVYPNYNYKGEIFSSYDPVVLNSQSGQFVEAPQNFPYINYIANNEEQYTSRFLSGHQCTWQDVQNAIWRILFPQATANNSALRTILANSSEDCVQWIVDDAFAHGANYTPSCPGGKYLMIIFPVLPNDCNCTLDLNTQLVAFPTGGSCLNRCVPKVCTDVLRGGRRACLSGNCAPLPSTSPSITSQPVLPSTTNSATATPSSSNTPAPSVSGTPAPSSSVTPTSSSSPTSVPSQSGTPAPSVSSTPAPSVSGTPAPSITSTPAPSTTNTASYTPCPSTTNTASSTPCPSTTNTASSTPCPSTTNTASHTPCPSTTNTASRTPCPSTTNTASHTPCPSTTNTARPSRSSSSTPCPSRSNFPSHSNTKSTSITSRPILPSTSSTPCPSRTPSKSAECHMTHSASPSKSDMCMHMTSTASASPSDQCQHMVSPSPSPCDKPDKPGKGHGKW